MTLLTYFNYIRLWRSNQHAGGFTENVRKICNSRKTFLGRLSKASKGLSVITEMEKYERNVPNALQGAKTRGLSECLLWNLDTQFEQKPKLRIFKMKVFIDESLVSNSKNCGWGCLRSISFSNFYCYVIINLSGAALRK